MHSYKHAFGICCFDDECEYVCLDDFRCYHMFFNLTMSMFLPLFDIYMLLPWMKYEMRWMVRCMLGFQCYM